MFEELGSAIQTGIDVLLNRPGSYPNAIPKEAILSSRVTLNFLDSDGQIIEVAQFEELSKEKIFTEKKRFKPFGSTRYITLKEDGGWNLTLTGEKTDDTLNRLIYIQEKFLGGTGLSSIPNSESTFNSLEYIHSNLLFTINETIIDNSNTAGTYSYRDVAITGYSESVPKDNEPCTFSLSLFSPFRDFFPNSLQDPDSQLETVLTNMIVNIVSKNKH